MEAKTRNTFIEEQIDKFLESKDESIKIRLYGSEVKKFVKRYPTVNIQTDGKVTFSLRQPMILCTISRK